MPHNANPPFGNSDLSSEQNQDLELLRRAIQAGLLPADAIRQVEEDETAAESLLEVLSRESRSMVPPSDSLHLQSNLEWESKETSAGCTDTVPNRTDQLTILGLPDRYQVVRPIGKGGMGRVFSANDAQLKRQVSIKVLNPELGGAAWTQMMRRESEVLARLRHPGIVPVYDVGQLLDGSPYIVMPLVEGQDLDEYVAANQLGWRDAVMLVLKVSEAVGHAHLVNIVHRDLKPKNIRITPNGQVIVLDFGIAKSIGDGGDDESHLGESKLGRPNGQTCGLTGAGTPAYMSPEQAASQSVDLRTDVYALGVLLYQLLSGHLPWEANVYVDRTVLIDTISRKSPPSVRSDRFRIPRDLVAIVHRCLAIRPCDRFANASELADELRRLVVGHAVETYARGRPWYVLRRFLVRNRVPVAGFVLALLATLLATVTGFVANANRLKLALSEERRKGENAANKLREREDLARTKWITDSRDSFQHRSSMDAAVINLRLGQLRAAGQALSEIPPPRAHWETAHLGLRIGSGIEPSVSLCEHEHQVLCGAFTRDRRRLATSGLDGMVLVWDLKGDRLQTKLRSGIWCQQGRHWRRAIEPISCCPPQSVPADHVLQVAWLNDHRRLMGTTWQGDVIAWDTHTSDETILYHHPQPLVALAISPNGTFLVGDLNGGLVVGDVDSTGPARHVELVGAPISSLASLVDGRWCVGREDGEVSILDAHATRVVHRAMFKGPIWDLATDDTKPLLAIAPDESRFAIWDLSYDMGDGSSNSLRRLSLTSGIKDDHTVPHKIAIDTEVNRVCVGDSQGYITLWNLADPTAQLQIGVIDTPPTPKLLAQPLVYQRRMGAIAMSSDGEGVWTAGANTLVQRWNVSANRYRKEIQAGKDPHAVFDRQHPELLWVATGHTLALVDSWVGKVIEEIEVPLELSFNGISSATNSTRVATCAGSTIHCWHRKEKMTGTSGAMEMSASIRPVGAEIQHDALVRSIALTPDGKHVAAYDEHDRVVLWEVESGLKLALRGLIHRRSDHADAASTNSKYRATGTLAFNSDGTQLLVCGPEQSPFLLASDTLELLRRPGVASGNGPTAIAWNPKDPSHMVVGDSNGAVRHDPANRSIVTSSRSGNSEIRGLSFTADGRRLAIIHDDGAIEILDSIWKEVGMAYAFTSDHAFETRSPIASLEFDPTCHRLLVTFADGMLEIWESQLSPSLPAPAEVHAKHWNAREFDIDVQGDWDWNLRRQSITLDMQDRIAALCLKIHRNSSRSAESIVFGPNSMLTGEFVLGRELDSSFKMQVIDGFEKATEHSVGPLRSSHAIALDRKSGGLRAVYSLPVVANDDYIRQVMLFDTDDGKPPRRIGEPSNFGLDTSLLVDLDGHTYATHFDWDSYRTLVTRMDETSNADTQMMGRKGLYPAIAALDSHGRLSAMGLSKRWPKDSRGDLEFHCNFAWNDSYRPSTESILCDPTMVQNWLALDACDRPAATYTTAAGRDAWSARKRLHYATREGLSWNHELVLDWSVQFSLVSNHVVYPDGRAQVAYSCLEDNLTAIHLATRDQGHWTTERVHGIPGDEFQAKPIPITNLTLLIDSHGSPVIVGQRADQSSIRLLVLRSTATKRADR